MTTASASPETLTGARARTRRLLLDTAVGVLAKDASAPLGQIADAAGVGRTTLYRYFPDRADLLAALTEDGAAQIAAAHARARLDEGTAIEAAERLCLEYIELTDILALYFTGAVSDDELFEEGSPMVRDLGALAARGHADGTMDRNLSVEWITSTLTSLFYSAWEILAHSHATRFDVTRQLLIVVRKVLAP